MADRAISGRLPPLSAVTNFPLASDLMPTTGAAASKSNFSAVPIAVLLAISGVVVLGAVTYRPLMAAFRRSCRRCCR
ncbi:hypothetical protein ACH47V_13505 [Micromonospora chersina]|uniref:hypothetical protein n=1 Tax=Micromonospora chersina TaxID=47854 RepID=UPI0033F93E7F